MTEDMIAEAVKLYIETDLTLAQIADKFGVTPSSLHRRITGHTPDAFRQKRRRRSMRRFREQERHEQSSDFRQVPLADHDYIVERYLTTEASLEDIAAEYDVTRERIRQIIADYEPDAYRIKRANLGLDALPTAIEREFERRCRYALENDLRCVVCDSWVLCGPKRKTCSSECAEAWPILRSFPEIGGNYQRLNQAKTILSNPEAHSPSKVEWAQKMLSDNPPPPNRRFFQAGSKRAETIRRFRPDIYAQIVGDT